MNFDISNFNMTNVNPGCSVNSIDYASQFLQEPKSDNCQLMQGLYSSLTAAGTVFGLLVPPIGAGFMSMGQGFKIVRNMHCYDQTLVKAFSGDTNEGLGTLTALVSSVALPKGLQTMSVAIGGLFSVAEEAAQMKQQEDKKVVQLLTATDSKNQTSVSSQVGLMKIYIPTSKTDCNPLFIAADHSKPFLAKTLGGMESIYTAPRDQLGNSPLHNTVSKNDIATSKVLFSIDEAALGLKNKAGDTPLSIAVSKGFVKMTEWLVDVGSNANFISKNGASLAHSCYATNSIGMLRTIAKGEGFNVNVQNKFGQTLAHRAVRDERADWVSELKRLGADFKIKDFNGRVAS